MIAGIAALLSTLDKNPKSLAVLKKLEEPVTLHFPSEAPLDEVLKRIKGAPRALTAGKSDSTWTRGAPGGGEEPNFAGDDRPRGYSAKSALRLMLRQLGWPIASGTAC